MQHGLVPSAREYFRFYGLDAEKLAHAKPDALVMHPGPMNRGVEIDSAVADDPVRSVIRSRWRWASPCAWRCSTRCHAGRATGCDRTRCSPGSACSIRPPGWISQASCWCVTASSPISVASSAGRMAPPSSTTRRGALPRPGRHARRARRARFRISRNHRLGGAGGGGRRHHDAGRAARTAARHRRSRPGAACCAHAARKPAA